MEHRGVTYAVTLEGALADPATSRDLDYGYRCPECKGFVHLRKGPKVTAHFAHYPGEGGTCGGESVEHEAAKLRLKELIDSGRRDFQLQVGCPGHVNAEGEEVQCPGRNPRVLSMSVPAFDEASIEKPLPPYVLDVALVRGEHVVMGLEVFVTHGVEAGKRAWLTASGLPWFEVDAAHVLKRPMPWKAISSSLGLVQCQDCRDRAEAVERKRREEEAQRRLRVRKVWVALDGRIPKTPDKCLAGRTYRCPACKRPVTLDAQGGERAFLHAEGETCDANRAWVYAGMYAVHRQWERAHGEIRMIRRCIGTHGRPCHAQLVERLPECDRLEGAEPSLLLWRGSRLVGQLAFDRNAPDVGAPRRWLLAPREAVEDPAALRPLNGRRICASCEQRAERQHAYGRRFFENPRIPDWRPRPQRSEPSPQISNASDPEASAPPARTDEEIE